MATLTELLQQIAAKKENLGTGVSILNQLQNEVSAIGLPAKSSVDNGTSAVVNLGSTIDDALTNLNPNEREELKALFNGVSTNLGDISGKL